MQGTISNYDTPLFTPLLEAIGGLAHRRHGGTMDPADVSMRVIADHLRAMTFLIADGVVPSNEWRGYVLRKIMRRAMRHGRRLGLEQAVPPSPGRRAGRRDGRRVSGAGRRPRRRRPGGAQRGRALRGGAVGSGDRAGREDHREQPVVGHLPWRPGVHALRNLRHAARLHRGSRRQRRPARSTPQGFDRKLGQEQEQARAKSAFDGGRKAELPRRDPRRPGAADRRIPRLRRRRRPGDADRRRCSTTR